MPMHNHNTRPLRLMPMHNHNTCPTHSPTHTIPILLTSTNITTIIHLLRISLAPRHHQGCRQTFLLLHIIIMTLGLHRIFILKQHIQIVITLAHRHILQGLRTQSTMVLKEGCRFIPNNIATRHMKITRLQIVKALQLTKESQLYTMSHMFLITILASHYPHAIIIITHHLILDLRFIVNTVLKESMITQCNQMNYLQTFLITTLARLRQQHLHIVTTLIYCSELFLGVMKTIVTEEGRQVIITINMITQRKQTIQ
mmetsp:Transcript_7594/g.16544  ORF Transcript_7594/g.16544 Transcript_7594/m.16544 type:complete len:256 (-) Transcript_7594:667-1434(-)